MKNTQILLIIFYYERISDGPEVVLIVVFESTPIRGKVYLSPHIFVFACCDILVLTSTVHFIWHYPRTSRLTRFTPHASPSAARRQHDVVLCLLGYI